MLRAFRWFLLLYPSRYRTEFGEEMLGVLASCLADASRQGNLARMNAVVRESLGLVAGAAAEHVRGWFGKYPWFQIASRRIYMRSDFRYPRATAPMMLVILAGIILAIYRARAVALKTELDPGALPSLPLTFGLALLIVALAAAAGWLLLHSLHRSGVHRLSEANTWPQAK